MPADEILTLRLPATDDDELWTTLAAAGRNLTGAVRLVVVRGSGTDFFDGSAQGPAAGREAAPAGDAIGWLRRPDLITVAAVTGRATGAGLDVAMACDLRVVADDAELSASAMNERGPGFGVSTIARFGELLGYARALEFVTTTRGISGREAAALGLANVAVGLADFEGALAQLIDGVLTKPRGAVTAAKAMLSAAGANRLRQADDVAVALRLAASEI